MQNALGWEVSSYGSLRLPRPGYAVELSTRHLYYSTDPGMLVEVQAYANRDQTAHQVVFDPSTTSVEINGKIIAAQADLRENPFMEMHWLCGGRPAAPADLDRCGPLVVTFPIAVSDGQGFVVRLGSLKIDGEVVRVPDIQYCYVPRRTKWVKFHG